jgi:glutaredoxin 3
MFMHGCRGHGKMRAIARFAMPMSNIEIYGTLACPYCVAAKNFFSKRGLEWQERRVDLDTTERRRMLERADGRRSVPQIFVNGVHVGGFEDLLAAERDGRLAELLAINAA